jgi:hypothetical protein
VGMRVPALCQARALRETEQVAAKMRQVGARAIVHEKGMEARLTVDHGRRRLIPSHPAPHVI